MTNHRYYTCHFNHYSIFFDFLLYTNRLWKFWTSKFIQSYIEYWQARSSFSNNVKNLQAELDQIQELLEEEQEGKAELQRQLTKANAEAATWRNKYEIDGAQRVEELEDIK